MTDSLGTPADSSEPPPSGQRTRSRGVIALWGVLLLVGVLILLTRGPIKAPAFEQLTQYVCDPLPSLPTLGNSLQRYGLRVTCRDGNQVIYQRESIFKVSNQTARLECKRDGGLTKIWRMTPPGTYGEIVFHATCGDHIVIDYKNRAASYESTKIFVTFLGGAITILSAAMLITRWSTRRRRRRHC